jgi:putative ABC transport system permease protein
VGVLVMRRGARLAAVGVVLGLAAARVGAPAMREVLLEVSATDASVFAASAVALLVIAVLASAVPAWRAARVDPIESLRLE